MRDDAFLDWKRERVAIEREMDVLLKAAARATLEDRRVRQIQFAALIERRNAAMRNLLQSASPMYRSMRGGSWPLIPFPRTAEEIVEQGSELAASQTDEEVVEQSMESAAPRTAEEIAEESTAAPRSAKEMAEESAEPAAPRTAEEIAEKSPEPAVPPSAEEMADQGSDSPAFDPAAGVELIEASEGIFNFDLGKAILPQIPLARVEMVADVLEYRAGPEAPELANPSRFLPLWRVRVQGD
jgi:hypothetical protein